MQKTMLRSVTAVICLLAAGCANLPGIAPGTPAAAVESQAGKPFRVWKEQGGATSWEYPQGPAGRYTWMVRVGADGKVTRVDQVLDWPFFNTLTPGMPMTEVEHTLGRPYGKVTYPLTGETAWAWRWVETVTYRCFFAYSSPDGKFLRSGVRDEDSGDQGVLTSNPC